MNKEFDQIVWDASLEDHCRQIVRLAIREDLERGHDWTTLALVPAGVEGRAAVVSRLAGVVAGHHAARAVLSEMQVTAEWSVFVEDGMPVEANAKVAEFAGSARDLLTAERIILNLLGRLSGIATLTRKYVDAIKHTTARVYDTRKTTPGWRRLEKYAVRCGGGTNHRTGLYDAVLIKDNHLAVGNPGDGRRGFSLFQAVREARQIVDLTIPAARRESVIVEVEVDSLKQLEEVLPAEPDIVLLDNMSTDQLREAVARRDQIGPTTELEASGGVIMDTIGPIAETGVERISVGALTHSAANLDVGLDWLN